MGVRAHPYVGLDRRSHWGRAVDGVPPSRISSWYRKKFDISQMRVATAGSCFAQHIGRRLKDAGFRYLDAEPPPRMMTPDAQSDFGFGMYSARYGNIYTSRQLLQLAQRALKGLKFKTAVWSKGGGYVDPYRPTIQPAADTKREVMLSRAHHLLRVRRLFQQTDLFVFTLGLTETWASKRDGAVYPVAPGVSGGKYDPELHDFVNLEYGDVVSDMEQTIAILRDVNPNMHFLLTVSPVPLMATMTDQHVVVASSYSKSVLRAAAGHLADKYDFVDYFPSYEIVSSHVMLGEAYQSDRRSVRAEAVDFVMSHFFAEHEPPAPAEEKPATAAAEKVVCDEELLSAFGAKA